MAVNPACRSFFSQLSPFIDGELSPAERTNVERHISACKDCAGRVADLRAESGLIRVGLDMAADEVDFKDFAQKVMARVTPEKPPLGERIRVTLSEMFLYQRPVMISSMATALVVALIAVPLALRDGTPEGYASERMTVERVNTTDQAKIQPVVLETQSGDAIIWVVDNADEQSVEPGAASDGADDATKDATEPGAVSKDPKDKPEGGEL